MKEKTTLNTGRRWPWPRALSLCLAAIPVFALVWIVVNLAINSLPAIEQQGFSVLFGPEFSGVFTSAKGLYGLQPALWGTFLVLLIALVISFPVSLSMAILATEFSLGILSKALRSLLGVLSGIPPVVYALMNGVVATVFIIPKFCGQGLPREAIPPPGMTWWTPGTLPIEGSTLMGGILLAFLIIPFLAPMYEDSLKEVPLAQKEASFAVGANRWFTLLNVTLPGALPGVISATLLGLLKAMGDVMIVAWVIGFESGLPNPLFDVLQRTAPLSSTATGLIGGIGANAAYGGTLQQSVANFIGLVLLAVAVVMLSLAFWLQSMSRKKNAI